MNGRDHVGFIGRYSNSLQTIFSQKPRGGLPEQIAPKNHAAAGLVLVEMAAEMAAEIGVDERWR